MKRCPECRRDYYDDSLLYCLDDGVPLLEGPGNGEPATAVLPSEAETQNQKPPLRPARALAKAGITRHQRLKVIGGAGLLIAASGLIYWYSGKPTAPSNMSDTFDSVAVLPLNCAGENQADSEYLADGIADVLVNKLAEVPSLRVVPWVTSQQYRRSPKSLRELAGEMKVSGLVTGTLRRSGDRISVSIGLIDVGNDRQKWGDEFNASISDLFGVQRQIALNVARELRGKLTSEQESALSTAVGRNAEAYEFYLRGVKALKQDRESNHLAQQMFEKAVGLDPQLAEAYAGIGRTKYDQYYHGWSPGYLALEQAEANLQKAIVMKPDLFRAMQDLIRLYWQKGLSEEGLKLAREIPLGNNTEAAMLTRAHAYYFSGLWDKALPLFEQVQEVDPANRDYLVIPCLLFSHRYREAAEKGEAYLSKFGSVPRAELYTGNAYHLMGDRHRAKEHYLRALALAPDDFVINNSLGVLLKETGQTQEALATWQEGSRQIESMLREHPNNTRLRTWLAILYGYQGRRQLARSEEERVINDKFQFRGFLTNLGRARAALGEYEKGAEFLRSALDGGQLEFHFVEVLPVYGMSSWKESPSFQEFVNELHNKHKQLREIY